MFVTSSRPPQRDEPAVADAGTQARTFTGTRCPGAIIEECGIRGVLLLVLGMSWSLCSGRSRSSRINQAPTSVDSGPIPACSGQDARFQGVKCIYNYNF
jgi:hypothetical protein